MSERAGVVEINLSAEMRRLRCAVCGEGDITVRYGWTSAVKPGVVVMTEATFRCKNRHSSSTALFVDPPTEADLFGDG